MRGRDSGWDIQQLVVFLFPPPGGAYGTRIELEQFLKMELLRSQREKCVANKLDLITLLKKERKNNFYKKSGNFIRVCPDKLTIVNTNKLI